LDGFTAVVLNWRPRSFARSVQVSGAMLLTVAVPLAIAAPENSTMIPRQRIRASFVKPTGPSTASLAEQRREWENAASQSMFPAGISARTVSAGGVPAILVTPAEADAGTLLVHFHGGGFVTGSVITHRNFAAQLALACRSAVLLVDYRLAPEHPFPAARDDAVAAWRWALQQGWSPARMAVSADSAGGHVAVTALLALRDAGDPLPATVVLLSPWLDLTHTGESMLSRADIDPLVLRGDLDACAGHYLAGLSSHAPAVSPLAADLRDFPAVLIHVGTDEVLLSDSERFAARAREAGVTTTLAVWPELWHFFHAWAPELPEATTALAQVGEHLRRRLETK
jgi:monoterpene epsilon-lactone hydrolase